MCVSRQVGFSWNCESYITDSDKGLRLPAPSQNENWLILFLILILFSHKLTLFRFQKHDNQPALSGSGFVGVPPPIHHWNNPKNHNSTRIIFYLPLESLLDSYSFNYDCVLVCIHIYCPAAAVTPGALLWASSRMQPDATHVHRKMLFNSVFRLRLISFSRLVAKSRLTYAGWFSCGQKNVSRCKCGHQMRYTLV